MIKDNINLLISSLVIFFFAIFSLFIFIISLSLTHANLYDYLYFTQFTHTFTSIFLIFITTSAEDKKGMMLFKYISVTHLITDMIIFLFYFIALNICLNDSKTAFTKTGGTLCYGSTFKQLIYNVLVFVFVILDSICVFIFDNKKMIKIKNI